MGKLYHAVVVGLEQKHIEGGLAPALLNYSDLCPVQPGTSEFYRK